MGRICGIDDDEPFGLNEGAQVTACGCGGCFSLASFIIFCVYISSYHNLGPGEQMLIKTGGKWRAVNGPWSGQTNPIHKKKRREAMKLQANQFAKVHNKKTNERKVVVGPYFGFLEADEESYNHGTTIVLARDEFVRLINPYNGQERVVAGPTMLYEDVHDNFKVLRLVRKKATYLDEETAAVVANAVTATMTLKTHCSNDISNTLYVPPPLNRVVEERKLTYIKPHEVFVIRDENGGTFYYDGGNASTVGELQCKGSANMVPGGGASFWLEPYSRIMRYRWSDYSVPPDSATSLLVQTPTGTRRRRTTRNTVVVKKRWSVTPRWWLVAGDFNKAENFWLNRGSGPNLTKVVTSGAVTVSDAVGGGPSANLMSIKGSTSTKLNLGNLLTGRFTMCTLTRYAGGSRKTVLEGINLVHGHYNGRAGVGKYGTRNSTQMRVTVVEPVLDWVPMCAKSQPGSDKNVMVGDEYVGLGPSASLRTSVTVNTRDRFRRSDFAIAEVIVWPLELTDAQMRTAMNYMQARLDDAKTYWDQPNSLGEKQNTRYVTHIDKRMQRSFYKFEVRSQDNVKMDIEGTVYWQIFDPQRAVTGTQDPEGDVWLRARSILTSVVSSYKINDFILQFNTIVQTAFQTEMLDAFYSDRGIEFIGIDVLDYQPKENRTITSLNTVIKATTQRMVALSRQRTQEELRANRIAADLRMESNKTALIQAQALNDRLEAETRGATEGSRKATTVNAFLNGIADDFPNVTTRVKLYREHIVRHALGVQTKNIFGGEGKVFMKPKGQNMTLLLPTDDRYHLPDERRLDTAVTPPMSSASPSAVDIAEAGQVDYTSEL